MIRSPLVTGALTISAADLQPAVEWAISGFHGGPPANLSGLLAGAVVMALHYALNWFSDRADAKAAAPADMPKAVEPVAPAAPAAVVTPAAPAAQ